MKIYEDVYGKNDSKTSKAREKMADILYKAGKVDEAIEELKKVEVRQ